MNMTLFRLRASLACLVLGLFSCRSLSSPSQTRADSLGERPELYILAGQSNMAGQSPLTPEIQAIHVPDVYVFCVYPYRFERERDEYRADQGFPQWEPLHPCGASPEFFGPELSFAQAFRKAKPGTPLYLIKYAHGGTSLACEWQPDPASPAFASYGLNSCQEFFSKASKDPSSIRTYRRFRKAVQWGLEGLSAQGIDPVWGGMLWFQGEADAEGRAPFRWLSANYPTNLTHFVQSVRRDLQHPELPFVMGQIKCGYEQAEWDSSYHPLALVRQTQANFARNTPQVSLFDTLDLAFKEDGCHYNTESMRIIGQRFAESLGLGTADQAPRLKAFLACPQHPSCQAGWGWLKQGEASCGPDAKGYFADKGGCSCLCAP